MQHRNIQGIHYCLAEIKLYLISLYFVSCNYSISEENLSILTSLCMVMRGKPYE